MFLKALELQGFKSFPDKTKVVVDTGITAVVGPNGSGKSNISDAIRWVLGETSAKQLRGGGKMENVIFGGTSNRKPMGYASVKLVLDNTDRGLAVEADEVTIGRRYYRSGESEYYINGNSVRLKDVYEMLLDTGIGRDGYSIIGQGRIAEIVGAKSAERREIFEEASGIARYRYRKNAAERDLAAAEENLIRLRDILNELEVRVGPLARESEKAQKFLALSDECKTKEVTLWVDTVHSTMEELRDQKRKVEAADADYQAKERELSKIDEDTQEIRLEMEHLAMAVDEANGEIRRMREELAGQDTRVAVLKAEITHNEASIVAWQEDIAKSGSAESEIDAEIGTHNAEIAKIETELAEIRGKIGGLEGELADMHEKSLAVGERRGELQANLADMTERSTQLQVQAAAAESSLASAEARLSEEQRSMEKAEADVAALSTEKTDTDAYLAKLDEEITKLENIKGGLALKLEQRSKAFVAAEEDERDIRREADQANHRISMLKELEQSMEGFYESVKRVVRASREGRLRGIIGPVSTVLSVKPGYETAVEMALGNSMQNIVVENEAAAKEAIGFLKSTNGGRATFLPLDTVKPQKFDGRNLPEDAILAQSVVTYDARYENVVSSLLGRIVVVETLNDATRTARALDYRNRVVTRDGQIINAGGSMTGGSVSKSAGLFSRKKQIEELESSVAKLLEKQKAAAAETAKLKAEVDALNAELTATNSEAVTAGGDKIRATTELARIVSALSAGEGLRAQLKRECDELAEKIAAAQAEQKLAVSERGRLTKEIELLSTELAAIAGEGDEFLQKREQLSAALGEHKLAALAKEGDAETHRQAIGHLQSRTGENAARREALLANIERLRAQNEENAAKIAGEADGAGAAKEKIAEIEAAIKEKTAARMEKEKSIQEQMSAERAIMAERESVGKEIARLQEQQKSLDERYGQTIDRLYDEYQLTLAEAEGICVEFESLSALKRLVAELHNKIRALGSVNVAAIEEFREVSERYNFLKTQVGDVESSKAELEKMIAELCAEMTTLFAASFTEINNHFTRIFHELFGGGTASLSLSEPDNLLESGIDIKVSPPGKIINNLSSLSGGEQALVAICIYFAILAVNPSPFCVLDEIEAALDDVNVVRYAQYLRRISNQTQFIVITHRRGTMEEADVLYGVTMQEKGVSQMLRLNVADVDAELVR